MGCVKTNFGLCLDLWWDVLGSVVAVLGNVVGSFRKFDWF